MVRRIPKFPLKMANGANVRSLEELRKNADMKTIISNFQSGKLALWCRAFGYEDLPESFDTIGFEMIKNLYTALNIPVNDDDIKAYIDNNSLSTDDSSEKVESENCIEIDYERLKKHLSHLNDLADTILQNSTIMVSLNLDNDGKNGFYRADVTEKEMDQHMSFVSPYSADNAEDSMEQLCQNIAFTIENLSVRAYLVRTRHVVPLTSLNK